MSEGALFLKEKLERKLNFISSLESEADFYLEVCNYLHFILSDSRLTHIVGKIKKEREKIYKPYNELANKAISRLIEIRHELQEFLIQSSYDKEESDNLFEHFDKLFSGDIQTSSPKWSALEYDLYQIFWKIIENNPTINLDQFITKKDKNIRLNNPDDELLSNCKETLDLINLIKKTSIWGAWDRLFLIYESAYTTNKEWWDRYQNDPLSGMGISYLMGQMKNILSNGPTFLPQDQRIYFNYKDRLLDFQRLYIYIIDNLDKTNLGIVLLKKFKQKCEWYNRDALLEITKIQTEQAYDRVEKRLTNQLSSYLHDNGVIPLSEVIFGQNRPDILGLHSREGLFPIEVKVIKYHELQRLKRGFNQILEYLGTIDIEEGFYVIFCRGTYTLDILDTIMINNKRINIVTIAISESPPSQRPPKIWRVTKDDLIGK